MSAATAAQLADDRVQDFLARSMAQAGAMAASKPILFGPDNKPLRPSSEYAIRRLAASRTGSMRTWTPRRLYGDQAETRDRGFIVSRAVDLAQSDPHAAGIVDSFAATIVGAGLVPHPAFNSEALGLTRDQAKSLSQQQKNIYASWAPFADAGERMSFGQIQYLIRRNLLVYGEFLVLLPMIDDPLRPFNLAVQVINPQRLKTPVDLVANERIRDGVELGDFGQPVAYWIKRAGARFRTADTSANFLRIPARKGHRWNVLHAFAAKDPEQVRGWPIFTPVMKCFRDFGDLLDAELVSSVVTAALAYFIELQNGADPWTAAGQRSTYTEATPTGDERRYEAVDPGLIMYGNPGEKPHLLAPDRPGKTFEPFVKIVKKSMAMALNIPYAVLFKDVSDTNYAGFRSAMLDAWRVFSMERIWQGEWLCQPIHTMLMEEAFLRGQLSVDDFYANMHAITRCEWRGAPKGDIEPVKQVQADALAVKYRFKTRQQVIAEQGGELRTTFEQLKEEEELAEELGIALPDGDILGNVKTTDPDKDTDTDESDDK